MLKSLGGKNHNGRSNSIGNQENFVDENHDSPYKRRQNIRISKYANMKMVDEKLEFPYGLSFELD